jgi:hypothetical protein
MSAPSSLVALAGQWSGKYRLWLSPDEPAYTSQTTAVVALVAQGQFVTVQYTWADEGAPQDGLLVLGYEVQRAIAHGVWIDSWHMYDQYMVCQGTVRPADGVVSLKGTYAAAPGPDWGWWIDLEPQGADAFRIVMHNVSPEGKAALAVECSYSRQA